MLPYEEKSPSQKAPLDYVNWLLNHSLEDIPVTGITSRDQIIDPYVVVGDPSSYGFTRKGKARYEAALASAKLIQQQQEAAYKEWYESPEQQAARQREVGINPDLAGLADSQAAAVQMPEGTPLDGIPTDGEVALNVFNMLTSVVGVASSAASLATSFSGIKFNKLQGDLIQAQVDAQTIANVSAFEQKSYGKVIDRLSSAMSLAANAGEVFDIDSWFADDSNFNDILSIYAPDDHPRYSESLASIRKGSQEILGKAYKQSQTTGQNRMDFAKVLADPYHSTDAVLSSAALMPVMHALRQFEKAKYISDAKRAESTAKIIDGVNFDSVIGSINAHNYRAISEDKFFEDYYNSADGSEWSESDFLLKSSEAIAAGAKAAIYRNLWDIYERDPNSLEGRAAAYQIGSGLHMSWEDFLLVNGMSIVSDLLGSKIDLDFLDADNDPKTNEGSLGWKTGRPSK